MRQQDDVVTWYKPVPQMPVCFPPKPPRPISFYRIPETPGKSKTNSAAIQAILQYKKLRAPAAG
jgi:hypothetical protein